MPPSALIVGCGRIAGGFNDADESAVLTHALAYRRLGVGLVACCDRDAARAARFAQRWEIPRHGSDAAALLGATRPDLVSLCTPPSEACPLLEVVLAAPGVRGVLVEKPLGGTAEEARRIATLAGRDGRPLLVDYFRAFDPFYDRLLGEVRGEGFGAFREGTARYYGAADVNAVHWLERVIALFGPPVSATRLGGAKDSPRFEVRFQEGPVLFLPSDGCQYAPFELDLLFERRRVRVVDSERRVEHFRSDPDPRFPGYWNLAADDPWPGSAPSPESVLLAVRALLAAASGMPVDWRGLLERSAAVTDLLEQIA